MAERPVLRRRVERAKPVEEEIEDEDVEDDIDTEEEEEVEELPRTPKKITLPPAPVKKVVAPPPAVKRVVKPEPVVAADEEEDEEDEEAPAPAPVVKKSAPVKVSPVAQTVVGTMFTDMISAMADGTQITITKVADDKWVVASGTPKIIHAGLRGNAYWKEVLSDEYLAWYEDWHNAGMSNDDKIKKAKKLGVKWKEDTDPRVNIMRATEAYREHMGVTKYKPEYTTSKARRAVQNGE